jgi:IS5 family transposase
VPDYTTIWWRVSRMDNPAPPIDVNEPIVIAIDSSGVKVTNKGEWMRKKWRGGEYKGWIKVHVAVDVHSKKVMAMEVTDERTADHTVVPSLIRQIEDNGGKVKRVLADGAYYKNQVYNLLEEKGIDAGIRMRKDARTRAIGSPYRARCVREFKSMGCERCKEEKDYGKRWLAEALFSSFKRIFGEHVVSKRTDLMYQEVRMKLVLYSLMLSM